MITELTPEQEALLPKYAERWTAHGLCTDPMNIDPVPADMKLVYEAAGLTCPEVFIYLESPAAADYLLNIIEKEGEWDVEDPEKLKLEYLKTYCEKFDFLNCYNTKACYGQFDSFWLGFYEFWLKEFNLECCEKLQGLINCAKNIGWFWPTNEFVIVTNRPKAINMDDEGRLHCEDAMAVEYRDGWGLYAWHGVRVPAYVIEEPEKITVKDIDEESNAEVRRIKVTRYGPERYIVDSGAEEIHTDDFGTLYRKELQDDEPIVMVKVINSSAEPDGSYKEYWLRVPPEMERAKQAIAWTFGMAEDEYVPLEQT